MKGFPAMNIIRTIKSKIQGDSEKLKFTPSDKAERINPDPDMGLSAEQVEERTRGGFVNITTNKSTKSTAQIIISNVFTYFNLIFFILAAILIAEKSYTNLTFLIVIFFNTAIGIVQELRSKKTLEKLTLVAAPLTKVIRDGKEEMVNSDELVLDDIVVFGAGNQIIADAVICDGEVNVNEALVTGESDEIKKDSGMQLLSGSFIVSGSCRARLDKVGPESFASKLAADAKKIKKKQQPGMMRSLTILIRIIGIIIVPLAIATYFNQHVRLGYPVKESVEGMTASVVGMIPQGLYLLTTIALAVSVIRLAKKRILVHDLKCIETLARVDVICVDKTGTVTEPEMTLQQIVTIDPDFSEEKTELLVRDFVMNMSSDNITMNALKQHFKDKRAFRPAESVKAFSSATKYSAVSFGRSENYVLGAPEFIMHGDYESIREICEQYSSKGERVLLFAEYSYRNESENIFGDGTLEGIVYPIGLVTLKNKIRPEARETFEYFTKQGVQIKVISGDNPVTVSKAAEEAGIPGSDKYVDASLLNNKDKIAKGVLEYNVFGRVTPEQKKQFIRALKKAGHTVAMTGDGVNDVLALKDADCSIAMASGSDAAANVADLVLLDSDFSAMPSVVAEGRRVINNIERSASLFLVKNIFSFFMTIFALISVSLYPFQPWQLSIISDVFIGFPSFFLALEPNSDMVTGKFLRNVLAKAFPCALTAIILVGWSLLFKAAFKINDNISSTVAFFVYSFVSYIMLYRVCHPMNVIHRTIFGAMGALYVGACFVIPWLFKDARITLNYGGILIISVLIALAIPLNKLILSIFKKLPGWRDKTIEYVETDIEKHKNDVLD